MSIIPRWAHRAYAAVAGYYWLPCPLCRREFGGHEHHQNFLTDQTWPGPGVYLHICPRCAAAGKTDVRVEPAGATSSEDTAP